MKLSDLTNPPDVDDALYVPKTAAEWALKSRMQESAAKVQQKRRSKTLAEKVAEQCSQK